MCKNPCSLKYLREPERPKGDALSEGGIPTASSQLPYHTEGAEAAAEIPGLQDAFLLEKHRMIQRSTLKNSIDRK